MSSIIERAMRSLSEKGSGPREAIAKVHAAPRLEAVGVPSQVPPTPEFSFDFGALQRAGYLTQQRMEGAMGEEYRRLKRPVLLNAMGKGAAPVKRGNMVIVTSSLPGEGKTFTSLNLALSVAQEQDNTVLLVDADLIRCSLTRVMGLEGVAGLTDVLTNRQMNLRDVIGRTNIPKLRLLPAGNLEANATELLASERMEAIAAELADRYGDRIIIFDAPPLLATSQTLVLARLMGQVLLVVEEGRTAQSTLQEALGLLDESQVVGLVLNKCTSSAGKSYYGGYYGRESSAQS